MASDPPTKSKGLSLYANLLDPSSNASAPGTISRAPVVFKHSESDAPQQDEAAAKKQQLSAAAFRFQPTKRPQINSQKPKHLPSKAIPAQKSSSTLPTNPEIQDSAQKSTTTSAPKTTLADWTAEDDADEWGYGEKRQRGGRKKRKKNREEQHVVQNWDDIYDPSRPNNYEEYRHSDEKIREIRDWKDRLYAHRMKHKRNSFSDSDDDMAHRPLNQFAPPSFHPPPPEDSEPSPPPPPPPPADIPDDATGEDAYARRLRLSQQNNPALGSIPPPPPASSEQPGFNPPTPAGTISRAPVRYNLPPAPEDLPKNEAELESALKQEEDADEEPEQDAPRSLRPGQKGFAARFMSKYGWTKGTGLGAKGSGIINPLQVKVEKQKKKPDSEGGGFVGPGGRGKIIGGNKKDSEDVGKFGVMSDVIRLQNMLKGMDVMHELTEGNLRQEIGEECGEKVGEPWQLQKILLTRTQYGTVERVYVDPKGPENAPVYIKFTSQLSALRAVNALEGRVFNGNTIIARYYDSDAFGKGVFE